MQHTNPVFQVLVTSGVPSPVVLAKNQRPAALKGGQIGFFSAHTGLSIDATSTAEEAGGKDFYIMVGINKGAAANAADDIQGSAGYHIQPRNTSALTLKGHTNEVPKIVEVSGVNVVCENDYCIKILISNQQSYQVNGFNTLTKTYCAWSGCCAMTDCGDCPPPGSSAAVVSSWALQINADPDKLVTAIVYNFRAMLSLTATGTATNAVITLGSNTYTVPIAAGDTPTVGAQKIANAINAQAGSTYKAAPNPGQLHQVNIYPVTTGKTNTDVLAATGGGFTYALTQMATEDTTDPARLKAMIDAGAGGGLRIVGAASTLPSFKGDIPNKYFKAGTNFEVAGLGLCSGAVITTTQEAIFPSGKGYDLKYLEFVAGGWNGKPGVYRQLSLTGLPKDDFEYFTTANGTYNIIVISNDIESVAGNFTTYKNPVATYIAVPCADSTVFNGIAAVLDKIYAGRFEVVTDATAIGTCSSPATSLLPAGATGIEFVA